jgi:hypothetical protein
MVVCYAVGLVCSITKAVVKCLCTRCIRLNIELSRECQSTSLCIMRMIAKLSFRLKRMWLFKSI